MQPQPEDQAQAQAQAQAPMHSQPRIFTGEADVAAYIAAHHQEITAIFKQKMMAHPKRKQLARFTISAGARCPGMKPIFDELWADALLEHSALADA